MEGATQEFLKNIHKGLRYWSFIPPQKGQNFSRWWSPRWWSPVAHWLVVLFVGKVGPIARASIQLAWGNITLCLWNHPLIKKERSGIKHWNSPKRVIGFHFGFWWEETEHFIHINPPTCSIFKHLPRPVAVDPTMAKVGLDLNQDGLGTWAEWCDLIDGQSYFLSILLCTAVSLLSFVSRCSIFVAFSVYSLFFRCVFQSCFAGVAGLAEAGFIHHEVVFLLGFSRTVR